MSSFSLVNQFGKLLIRHSQRSCNSEACWAYTKVWHEQNKDTIPSLSEGVTVLIGSYCKSLLWPYMFWPDELSNREYQLFHNFLTQQLIIPACLPLVPSSTHYSIFCLKNRFWTYRSFELLVEKSILKTSLPFSFHLRPKLSESVKNSDL